MDPGASSQAQASAAGPSPSTRNVMLPENERQLAMV